VANKWTDLDADEEGNQKMFNMLFTGQSSQDIKRKLQKVDGARGNVYFSVNQNRL